MESVKPDFLQLLIRLRNTQLEGERERWRKSLIRDGDFKHGCLRGDEGLARTRLASVTLRCWQDSAQIPHGIKLLLSRLGVEIRW